MFRSSEETSDLHFDLHSAETPNKGSDHKVAGLVPEEEKSK